MNKKDLIDELNTIKVAKRVARDKSANFVLKHPESFSFLLDLMFKNNSRTAIKAAWVFELVCQENILLLEKYLNYFINNLDKISDESALRPISKVCSFVARSYQNNQLELTNEQKEKIIEVNFDWIIEEHKVASQVFAMDTLFILGKEYDWVHTELKLILEKNTTSGSAGYQAHAKKILNHLL
ncbi:MAG: hypothetical protein KAH67_06190 [Flavobacteriaceae bacterium]|nr:hypothetical protein [Flavobacteriaceae bacterium]